MSIHVTWRWRRSRQKRKSVCDKFKLPNRITEHFVTRDMNMINIIHICKCTSMEQVNVYPRGLDSYYLVSYYIKWVKTSWGHIVLLIFKTRFNKILTAVLLSTLGILPQNTKLTKRYLIMIVNCYLLLFRWSVKTNNMNSIWEWLRWWGMFDCTPAHILQFRSRIYQSKVCKW